MTIQLVNRLNTLATGASAEFGPKLAAAAADLEHKVEAWTSAVDAWVEAHFSVAAEHVRIVAGEEYRQAVREAHDLIARVKATL